MLNRNESFSVLALMMAGLLLLELFGGDVQTKKKQGELPTTTTAIQAAH
jgi:hypothetical protein